MRWARKESAWQTKKIMRRSITIVWIEPYSAFFYRKCSYANNEF